MDDNDLNMVFRTKVDEFEFEVEISDISDIEAAYLQLLNVRKELTKIQEKHSLLLLTIESRNVAAKYWIRKDDCNYLEEMKDKAVGIMLSLLDVYPDTKMIKTIVQESGIPRSTVSDYLNGITGGKGSCFEKEGSKWKLTIEGLTTIFKFLKVSEEPE